VDGSLYYHTWFDAAIERLLVGLLIFMPVAFGVRRAWSEQVVVILSGLMLLCFAMKLLIHRSQPMVWSWAYVPIALFVAVVLLQLAPLPRGVVDVLSPNTAAEREALLRDFPGANRLLTTMSLSFYRRATWHDLRLVLSVSAVFVVVLNVVRQASQVQRLLKAIALIGGAVAVLALLQALFGNGKYYWFITPEYPVAIRSGPFVNRNHYAQFMALSVGAGLAYLCIRLHEAFAGRRRSLAGLCEYLGSRAAREVWMLIGLMGMGVATVLIAMSRGGAISLVISGALTVILLSLRSSLKGSGWIMVILAVVAFACVVFTGLDAIIDRFANLGADSSSTSRMQILKDLTAAYGRFPAFGTGLGTHAFVYPMFKQIDNVLWYTHAENEYAQVLEETGVAGLAALALFGLMVMYGGCRCLRRGRLPICSAVYGLGFGLTAILIHSLTDFGQHMPANAMLSAVFCALVISLARQGLAEPAVVAVAPAVRAGYLWRPAFLVLAMGVFGLAVWASDRARAGETHWAAALKLENALGKRDWQGDEAEYAQLISHAARAAECEPGDVRYLHWLAVYRWHELDQQAGGRGNLINLSQQQQDSLEQIITDLRRACAICPVYGPAYSVLGQIELFVLDRPEGAENIRRGLRLSPSDPVSCFVAGRLDVIEGDMDAAAVKFQKAVSLNRGLFKDVVNIFLTDLSRPQLALAAAEDDIWRLNYVARLLDAMQYTDLATEARAKAKSLLGTKKQADGASATELVMLAEFLKSDGENEQAAECYRRALALDYGQVAWRLSLAELLVRMDRVNEAFEEVKTCLRLHPRYAPARKLALTLATHPAVLNSRTEIP